MELYVFFNILKFGKMNDPIEVLGHWITSLIGELLVELHELL